MSRVISEISCDGFEVNPPAPGYDELYFNFKGVHALRNDHCVFPEENDDEVCVVVQIKKIITWTDSPSSGTLRHADFPYASFPMKFNHLFDSTECRHHLSTHDDLRRFMLLHVRYENHWNFFLDRASNYAAVLGYDVACSKLKPSIINVVLDFEVMEFQTAYEYSFLGAGASALVSVSSSLETVCSICLDELYTTRKNLIQTRCKHVFHQPCINHWLDKRNTCPLCRSPVQHPVFAD